MALDERVCEDKVLCLWQCFYGACSVASRRPLAGAIKTTSISRFLTGVWAHAGLRLTCDVSRAKPSITRLPSFLRFQLCCTSCLAPLHEAFSLASRRLAGARFGQLATRSLQKHGPRPVWPVASGLLSKTRLPSCVVLEPSS